MKHLGNFINLILLAVSIVIIASCAVNPVTGKKQLMLMSEEQEIALGAQYDPSVVASFGVYEDEDLLRFIKEKGDEMAKISHRPNLQFHYKILDTPVINAFAVPGGYIYFTRGILAQFNNEAELVGVLGHEMGHVTARHTVSQQSKQQLGQILLIGGMLASEKFRQFGDYAMQGMQLLFLKFSRDNENESDRLGVEYATKIGYDAREMGNFFNVLKKKQLASEHAGIPTFMSTHPDPGDRYNKVHQKAKQWQDSINHASWAVNRDSYLRMIDGMVYGEDPRQGFVDGDVFYHPGMAFKYPVPKSWQVQNSPMQVQMAPQDGKAAIIFTLAQQKTKAEAATETLKQLNLEVLDNKETNVNGFPSLAILSQQVNQNQQTGEKSVIKVLSYFIDYAGKIFVFHGVSTDADFNSYFRVFETTMVNFNRLTEPSKLNVQPKRINIKTVRKSGTLAEAFNYYQVPQNQLQELAFLNDMELSAPVKQGELIKLVGD